MNGSNSEDLREVWRHFTEQQYVHLATADGDQPRVRPVTLIHLWKKLFVATGSNDAKTKQIRANPKVEFSLMLKKGESKGTIRAECLAKIVDDKQVKAKIFQKISFIREFFPTPEDPRFALIELQPTSFEHMKPGSIEAVKLKP